MQFAQQGNGNGLDDLYILPETTEERQRVTDYLKSINHTFTSVRSNVKGQDWYGKVFIDVPFGEYLKPQIIKLMRQP